MLCRDCELWKKAKTNCIPMAGNYESPILLIGEGPGKNEDDQGIPFVGKSGRLLRQALQDTGIEDFAVTNCVRCRPFTVIDRREKDRPPTQEEINACIHHTWEDIAKMPNLKLIVAIGNVALRTLTGKQSITKVSGEEWNFTDPSDKKIKLMPLMHPSYVLQSQDKELDRFYDHVARIPRTISGNLLAENDFGEYTVIQNEEQWLQFINGISSCKIFTYDLETTGINPRDNDSYIKCIQFSWEYKKAWILPIGKGVKDHPELKRIFENKKIGKVGQNIKFDNLWMKTILGIDVKGTIWDTKIAEYLLIGKGSTGLKDMAWKYSKMGGYEKKLSDSPEKIDGEELWKYGGIDADLTCRIYNIQKTKIKKGAGIEHLFKTLLIPVSDVLMYMEYNGIKIDVDRVKEVNKNCEILIENLKKQMYTLNEVKEFEQTEETEFNPNSHKQIAYILFKICGLKSIKQTDKKGDSTDKEVLQKYASSSKLAQLLLEYSTYEQMRKTFLSELLSYERKGRIHTQLWLTETATGRTSSKKPNMQNMPKGEKDVLELRKCFIADPGYVLLEADMNQHELRVMAEIAGDVAMKKALQGDMHRTTASIIFGVKPEDVTDDMRREAKTVNFGIIYGLTPYGLSQQLGIEEEKAELWIYRFFEKYFMTKRYMEETSAFCKRYGYVEALSGRRRYFPSYEEFDITKTKEIINFPIQATASDILLYGAIAVHHLLHKRKSFLTLEVHDSLLINLHKSEFDLIDEIKEIMCTYPKQFMPFESDLKVDCKIGPSWGEMEEYK